MKNNLDKVEALVIGIYLGTCSKMKETDNEKQSRQGRSKSSRNLSWDLFQDKGDRR